MTSVLSISTTSFCETFTNFHIIHKKYFKMSDFFFFYCFLGENANAQAWAWTMYFSVFHNVIHFISIIYYTSNSLMQRQCYFLILHEYKWCRLLNSFHASDKAYRSLYLAKDLCIFYACIGEDVLIKILRGDDDIRLYHIRSHSHENKVPSSLTACFWEWAAAAA